MMPTQTIRQQATLVFCAMLIITFQSAIAKEIMEGVI